MFGPNVTIATANHPIEPGLRENAMQYNKPVHICENVWIGACTVIVPGVTIGKNSVIGAGSVVTKDIPENILLFPVFSSTCLRWQSVLHNARLHQQSVFPECRIHLAMPVNHTAAPDNHSHHKLHFL